MTNKETIEGITELLWEEFENEPLCFGGSEKAVSAANRIITMLKSLGYVKKAKDQSLPPLPEFHADWGGESGRSGYTKAQQDMIKDNFVKVEKEVGMNREDLIEVPLAEIPPRVILDPDTLTIEEVDPADFEAIVPEKEEEK